MSKNDWQTFLNRWSRLVLAAPGLRHAMAADVTGPGTLGRRGASEEEISRVEARLEIKLPPSYRAFLKVSDGWFIGMDDKSRLFQIKEVDWFSVRFPDMLQGWLTGYQQQGEPEPVPEEVYRVYGEDQDPSRVHTQDLRAALTVGEGDDAVYLLNPRVVDPSGEWEAWFFAPWLPGAERYRSFSELMQAEYRKVKERVDEEKAHIRSASSPDNLGASLPSLLAVFQKEIAERSQLARGAISIQEQYMKGVIEGLQYGEQQVRQIQEQAWDPGEIRNALEALAGDLEKNWQTGYQAAKQEGSKDMLGQMRMNAVAEGSRQAMGIVQWFLKEHPAP